MIWKNFDSIGIVCKRCDIVMTVESVHSNGVVDDGILVCPVCGEHVNVSVRSKE